MNPDPLIRSIISAMMLLEDSGPEEIDPDTAVRGMEHMGYELLKLGDGDRAEFVAALERIAEVEPAQAAFIRSIPFNIGMTTEPPR